VHKKIAILLSLALAAGLLFRRSSRAGRSWLPPLHGWQKWCGVIALLFALLILLNPEFLALDILGDTTFFDLLVLALSVQMLTYAHWAWYWLRKSIVRSVRWIGIPSFGLRYLIFVSTPAIGSAISSVQKTIHRISS